MTTPVFNTAIVAGPSTFVAMRQALTPAIRNALVSIEAFSMCASRYGKDGLKTMSHQLIGWNTPSMTSWPCGVCIQEFRLRIQNADNVVPPATISVATMCTRSETRPRPNSITER
jgi:hypothetical protein